MKRIFAITMAVCLTGGAALAEGHAPADAIIGGDTPQVQRQKVMSHVGGATKLGAAIAKEQAPFDAATSELIFRTLNATARGYGYLFPEGTQEGDKTEASPKIWEDRAGFNEAVAKFIADTEAKPADLDAFKTAFGAATANCGTCHKAWRVKN